MPEILGPDGRPIRKTENRPDLREIAVISVRDRYSGYPSQGLTPQKLAAIFKEADAGDVYRQMELFEEMEEKDTHLFSILQTRKNGVLGLDWDIIPTGDDPKSVEIATFVKNELENIPELEDVILDLLDAIGKGFSGSEIHWAIRERRAVIERIKWVPTKRFTFGDDDEYRLITDEDPARGIELPPNKFVMHRYKARSGHPSRAGVIRVCAWMYLFKNYDIKDWVAFAEIYGMPLRLGKYDANTSPDDRDALIRAVQSLGSDAAGIISKSTEIEFIEAVRGTTSDLYKLLADFCNAEMSKAVLGQTLTTEVGDKGSYAASRTHGEVRQDLLEADCKALSRTIRRDIIRPLVVFNFGSEYERKLPRIKFHYEPPEDLKSDAETYETLVEMGLPIAADHLYQKFGIPKPKSGDAILIPVNRMPGFQETVANKEFQLLRFKDDETAQSDSRGRQAAVDALSDRILFEFGPVGRAMLDVVREFIGKCSSLEEVHERIAAIYPNVRNSDLQDLVARSLFITDLYGRSTVDG